MDIYCKTCDSHVDVGSVEGAQNLQCPNCNALLQVVEHQSKENAVYKNLDSDGNGILLDGANLGKSLTKTLLVLLLACFVACGAIAIFAILGVMTGEVAFKIVLSTLSLGAYSLISLCCMTLVTQRRFSLFGWIGIAASVSGALFALLTNWEIVTGWELLLKGRYCFLVVAIAFGHASLLLLIETKNEIVRAIRNATLVVIALVAIVFVGAPFAPESLVIANQIILVLCVLDVLGTICTPLLHQITRDA